MALALGVGGAWGSDASKGVSDVSEFMEALAAAAKGSGAKPGSNSTELTRRPAGIVGLCRALFLASTRARCCRIVRALASDGTEGTNAGSKGSL